MDDPSEKIKSLLSDPDSLKMLAQLAGSFLGNSSQGNSTPASQPASIQVPVPDETRETQTPQLNFASPNPGEAKETAAIADVPTRIFGGHDERINLLKSIRPYLNDHRKTRVDGMIKALGTAKLLGTYKDENLLGFLGKKFK